MSTPHPLRRRFGLELALGLAIALVVILVASRGARETPDQAPPKSDSEGTALPRPELLARPDTGPATASPSSERAPMLDERSSTIPTPSPDALQVEVVDESGHPLAGIEVGLIGREPEGPTVTLLTATSTTDGRASLALDLVHQLRAKAAAHGSPFELAVGVVPPLEEWPRIELPDPVDPALIQRLVVAAEIRELFQPLRVRVVDAAGMPIAGVPVVLVSRFAHDRGSRFELGRAETRSSDGIAELTLANYRERLPHAELIGESLHRVELALPLLAPPALELGPRPATAEVATLVLGETGALVAHVLDPEGEPLEGVRVGLSYRTLGSGAWSSYWFAVSAHGRASFPRVGTGLELRLRASAEDGSWCVIELPGPGSPGEVEEVTLRLAAPAVPAADPPRAAEPSTPFEIALSEPRKVRGEIQDQAGTPLGGARIALALARGEGIQALATSRADGRFEVGLRSEPGPALLRVGKEGYLDCAREVLLDATQVVVRLERAACFEARVLLEPGFPHLLLEFELDGAALSPLRELRRCDVAPGDHVFEIRTAGSKRLLERVDGIQLVPGENPIDPRLDPLDLRGRWIVSTFRLLASDGAPITGSVRVLIDGLEDAIEDAREDGRLILVVQPDAAIVLEPDGYAARTVYPARDEQELAFARSE